MPPLPPGPAHVYPVCVPFTLANTLVLKKINFLPVSISAPVTQKLLLNFRSCSVDQQLSTLLPWPNVMASILMKDMVPRKGGGCVGKRRLLPISWPPAFLLHHESAKLLKTAVVTLIWTSEIPPETFKFRHIYKGTYRLLWNRISIKNHLLLENSMVVLKKLNTKLPYNPTIPPSVPKELKSGTWTGICVPMFTAALHTIVQRWEQPKCSPTKKMWYIIQQNITDR